MGAMMTGSERAKQRITELEQAITTLDGQLAQYRQATAEIEARRLQFIGSLTTWREILQDETQPPAPTETGTAKA